jgi:hypothetical protein
VIWIFVWDNSCVVKVKNVAPFQVFFIFPSKIENTGSRNRAEVILPAINCPAVSTGLPVQPVVGKEYDRNNVVLLTVVKFAYNLNERGKEAGLGPVGYYPELIQTCWGAKVHLSMIVQVSY